MKWLLCLMFVLLSTNGFAQEEDGLYPPNEFSIGLGFALPSEKDPLNIVSEPKVPTSFGLNLGYRRFLDERFSVGVRGYGYITKLSGYSVVFQGSSAPIGADFDFETFNLAAEALLLFGRRPVQLYGFLLVGYATGALNHNQAGTLRFNGITAGGGLGLRFAVSYRVGIAIEGLASFGSASWTQKPFSNSSGDKFNPGLIMGLASVLIGWG